MPANGPAPNGRAESEGVALLLEGSAVLPDPGPDPDLDPATPTPRWRWLLRVSVVLLLTLAALFLLLTDSSSRIAPPPPPGAEQVGAARAALRQFRLGQSRGGNTVISLDSAQLTAIGGLASNGFRPDRLQVDAKDGTVTVRGSRPLPLGRWLNVAVVTRGGKSGFPPAQLTAGSLTFSPIASRWIFEAARSIAVARGIRLPPLDRLVRRITVAKGSVTAVLSLPPRTGLIAQLSGDDARADPAQVRIAYCRLAKQQIAQPSVDFATQVRRAFATKPGISATPSSNRAAFIALAMLSVDQRVGELAGVTAAMVGRCGISPVATLLNGRADLPKHWALSAALAGTTGTQFSQAMGEWKELADSISRQSRFAEGDPSGFSLVDLATDRSGFLIAGRAVDPVTAARVAARLAVAQPEDLLPRSLLRLEEGASNADFTKKYGSTTDPRFAALLARIDAELRRSATARSGPLTALP